LPETEIQELQFEGDPLELLDSELSPYAVMELTFSTMVIVTIVLFVSMWFWLLFRCCIATRQQNQFRWLMSLVLGGMVWLFILFVDLGVDMINIACLTNYVYEKTGGMLVKLINQVTLELNSTEHFVSRLHTSQVEIRDAVNACPLDRTNYNVDSLKVPEINFIEDAVTLGNDLLHELRGLQPILDNIFLLLSQVLLYSSITFGTLLLLIVLFVTCFLYRNTKTRELLIYGFTSLLLVVGIAVAVIANLTQHMYSIVKVLPDYDHQWVNTVVAVCFSNNTYTNITLNLIENNIEDILNKKAELDTTDFVNCTGAENKRQQLISLLSEQHIKLDRTVEYFSEINCSFVKTAWDYMQHLLVVFYSNLWELHTIIICVGLTVLLSTCIARMKLFSNDYTRVTDK
jgi:hypothetical protein